MLYTEDTPEFEQKERERTALFEEATRIVRAAAAQSCVLTLEEDAHVLQIMAGVRSFKEQMRHLKRHLFQCKEGARTNGENTLCG